jgi:AcrR family transcriptional regulator
MTATGPTRHEQSAAQRVRVLTAAEKAFAEHGFVAAEMQDIARRAGVSRTAIYQDFASKQELFEAVVSTVLDDVDAVIARHRVELTGPEAIAPLVRAFWEWATEHPDAAVLLYEPLPGASAQTRKLRRDFEDRHIGVSARYFGEGDMGPLPDVVAPILVRSVIVMALNMHLLRQSIPALIEASEQDLVDATTAVAVRMLAAAQRLTRDKETLDVI